jgi:indole-3-glycerol phosphate synthase
VPFFAFYDDKEKGQIFIKASQEFPIRSGFFQEEYNIYESFLLGYQGLFLYASTLDHYEIQYTQEIARDLQMLLFWVVETKEELSKVQKTDAPLILISLRRQPSLNQALQFLIRSYEKTPSKKFMFCHLFQFSHEEDFFIKNSPFSYYFKIIF